MTFIDSFRSREYKDFTIRRLRKYASTLLHRAINKLAYNRAVSGWIIDKLRHHRVPPGRVTLRPDFIVESGRGFSSMM